MSSVIGGGRLVAVPPPDPEQVGGVVVLVGLAVLFGSACGGGSTTDVKASDLPASLRQGDAALGETDAAMARAPVVTESQLALPRSLVQAAAKNGMADAKVRAVGTDLSASEAFIGEAKQGTFPTKREAASAYATRLAPLDTRVRATSQRAEGAFARTKKALVEVDQAQDRRDALDSYGRQYAGDSRRAGRVQPEG
jgi:hypothetical protein